MHKSRYVILNEIRLWSAAAAQASRWARRGGGKRRRSLHPRHNAIIE
jgi:hypothetical protein